MERLTSRKNQLIRHLRRLGRERDYRRETGLFLCDGEKLFSEALSNGMEIGTVLFREGAASPKLPAGIDSYTAPEEIFDYVSPLVNSPGPLFSVKTAPLSPSAGPERVIVLENVQDPGNVGTAVRTAAALGIDLVILTGTCADPYNPKTVRSAMGALFRQPLAELTHDELGAKLREWSLPLYGAALLPESEDLRGLDLRAAAVAVGNEGSGLTEELLALCEKKIIIPMTPGSESLNAAVAAAVLMWEMARERL